MCNQSLNQRLNDGRSIVDITRDAMAMANTIGHYEFTLIDRDPYVGSMQWMVKLSPFVSLSIIRCNSGDVANLTDPNNYETAILVDGTVDDSSVHGGQNLEDVRESIRTGKIAAVLIARRKKAAALLQ